MYFGVTIDYHVSYIRVYPLYKDITNEKKKKKVICLYELQIKIHPQTFVARISFEPGVNTKLCAFDGFPWNGRGLKVS